MIQYEVKGKKKKESSNFLHQRRSSSSENAKGMRKERTVLDGKPERG